MANTVWLLSCALLLSLLLHVFLLHKQREPLVADAQDDPLFVRFPLSGTRVVGERNATVPTPFHCYDADVLVLQGRGNWTYLNQLLGGDSFMPVRIAGTDAAFVVVWIMDYSRTAMGGYRELIVSVVVSPRHQRGRPLDVDCDDNVYCSTRVLGFDPRVSLFPVKLWLSETVSIDYGRDVLGLDKVRCEPCDVERHGQRKSWRFVDQQSGVMLVEGSIVEDDSVFTLLNEMPAIARALGPVNLGRLVANAYSPLVMVGKRGIAPNYPNVNPVALSYSRVDPFATKIQRVDKSDVRLGAHPDIEPIDFVPEIASRTRSQRFVILNPHN